MVKLAETKEKDAAINAESYALAAMAIYLQKTFNLDEPPIPEATATPTPSVHDDYQVEDLVVESDDEVPTPVPLDSVDFIPYNATGDVKRMTDYGKNAGNSSM